MGSNREGLRVGHRRRVAECLGLSVLMAGLWVSSVLHPACAMAAEGEGTEGELRVTFGLVSLEVPPDYEIVVTSKQPDASIGYLEREEDGFRIHFALGMVGTDGFDEPDTESVAWSLKGESSLGQIEARLLLGENSKMRLEGLAGMTKLASRLKNEEDVGAFLMILRSVGPPCRLCKTPGSRKSSRSVPE